MGINFRSLQSYKRILETYNTKIMMIKIKIAFPMKRTTFLVCLFLIACTAQATQQPDSTSELPPDGIELNTKIYLQESSGMKDIYDASGVISLVLVNESESTVLIPSDFGAIVYVWEGSKWEEVDNVFGYPDGETVLPTTEEYPPGLVVLVEPDLTHNTDRPLILRITVTGILSDSNKEVGASLDVTLE